MALPLAAPIAPPYLAPPAEAEIQALPFPELYRRVAHHMPPFEWRMVAEDVAAILRLKQERKAVILAHNYQTPDIFHAVSDIVGDSLALARKAMETEAEVIVLAGVHFMAETAKLLNPDKTVLMPALDAGCSLAESITAEDLREMRRCHPGAPVVIYVNTSAAVKAESDICCTSGNALDVVKSLGASRVIMAPDEYLARNIAAELGPDSGIEIIPWQGHCEVHERFTAAEIGSLRRAYPGVTVVAHPECPPEVVAASDYAGSTAGMIDFVERARPARVALITECSMSDNIAGGYPDIEFVRPCNLCPHMKRITLGNIRAALEENLHEIEIDPAIAGRARLAVERMLAVK